MSDRFSEKWLETLCSLLPDVHSAVFMVPEPDADQLDALNEDAKLNLTLWPDNHYFKVGPAETIRRVLGIFITVILLNFWVSFWFRMLQNVAALKDQLTPDKV